MKPADFFIGVMDFFAILMPGALLVYLLLIMAPQLGTAVLAPPFTGSGEAVKWAAYGVAAYVSGHLLHHVGSVLDRGYDKGYASQKRRFGDERLLREARELVRADLGGNIEEISTFDWAGSWVRAHNDVAGAELERAGADSKFFRSLCIVAAIGVLVFLVRTDALAAVGSFALAWFSFRRFCKRRWESTQRTYEYFVMLRQEKGPGSGASAGAGSGAPARAATTVSNG